MKFFALPGLVVLLAAPVQAGGVMDPVADHVIACQQDTETETGPAAETAADLRALCDMLRDAVAGQSLSELTLVAETFQPQFLRAHLTWRVGSQVHRGPSVDFGFVDTAFGPSQYGFVVAGLLEATNLPIHDTFAP